VVDFRDHREAFGGVLKWIIAGISDLTPQEVAKATRILPEGLCHDCNGGGDVPRSRGDSIPRVLIPPGTGGNQE
jgi:hypothetical protein